MFISYKWLGRHVDLDGLTAEEVARDLTLRTAEVEGLERFAPHLGDVVVGHVRERIKHPDADKLGICTVDVGGPETLQIVCGAPNVAAGQRVAVAQVGCVLPGDFKIKKSKIRGVASVGMICSERELGLGNEHDGIWVLPGEPEIGAPVDAALGLEDWVIEIDNKAVTHRPDLWGQRGFAREIAAIYGRELRPLDTSMPECGDGAAIPVQIETDGCSRYVALPIEGVAAGRSPDWMRFLLLAVGQRPIDLTVDVSNFVMLDLGQPNHLFDRGAIGAEGIVVRDAEKGERMTTLDEVEQRFEPSDMLICSGREPVAVAGVMGGEASKVAESSTALVLEVASFHPTRVRRTAARLALRTDASARFEKCLSPTLVMEAAGHLVRTLQSIVPDLSLPAKLTDVGDWTDPACVVKLRPSKVRSLLGCELCDDEIEASLNSLGFETRKDGDHLAVSVPSQRASKDVTIEEDLIEEVGRMLRYDRIEVAPLLCEVRPVPADAVRTQVRQLKQRLAGAARFHEVLTYSFLPEELATACKVAEDEFVEVINPVSEGWQRIRRSIAPSVLGVVEKNLREQDEVRLFEVGMGYLPEQRNAAGEPREVREAVLVWAGPKPGKKARFDASVFDRLKGVLADLVQHLGRGELTWREAAEEETPAWALEGQTILGTPAGCDAACVELVRLEPEVQRNLGLAGDLALARIELDPLLEAAPAGPRYRPMSRFPGVKIDVALAVPGPVPAGDVQAVIESAAKGLAQSCELFDLYRGEQVGSGRKSLAYHVLLQSPSRTLSDKDGQKFLSRLERQIVELGGELRRE